MPNLLSLQRAEEVLEPHTKKKKKAQNIWREKRGTENIPRFSHFFFWSAKIALALVWLFLLSAFCPSHSASCAYRVSPMQKSQKGKKESSSHVILHNEGPEITTQLLLFFSLVLFQQLSSKVTSSEREEADDGKASRGGVHRPEVDGTAPLTTGNLFFRLQTETKPFMAIFEHRRCPLLLHQQAGDDKKNAGNHLQGCTWAARLTISR